MVHIGTLRYRYVNSVKRCNTNENRYTKSIGSDKLSPQSKGRMGGWVERGSGEGVEGLEGVEGVECLGMFGWRLRRGGGGEGGGGVFYNIIYVYIYISIYIHIGVRRVN